LGAEFTYCLGIFRDDWHNSLHQRGSEFLLAIRLLRHLREGQREGVGLSSRQLAEWEPGFTEEQLDKMLQQLQQAWLVLRTEEKSWVLARDLREVKLVDLYLAAPFVLPDCREELELESPRLVKLLSEVDDEIRELMNWPIEELL
jgi:membrane protein